VSEVDIQSLVNSILSAIGYEEGGAPPTPTPTPTPTPEVVTVTKVEKAVIKLPADIASKLTEYEYTLYNFVAAAIDQAADTSDSKKIDTWLTIAQKSLNLAQDIHNYLEEKT
jgi:hypothetical protein